MQIVEIELNEFEFYCPLTGEYILKEEEPVNEDATTLMAYWLDMTFEEPFIKDENLKKEWEQFCVEFAANNDGYEPEFSDFENFILGLDWKNWVCFKLTDSGFSCGPVSSSVWKIFNFNL